MLTVYTLAQAEEWDRTVRSFADHDVYWLSGYVKAFQLHGDGEPLLFSYEDGTVRGINVVMKRDIAEDGHFKGRIAAGVCFDFSTPYGYGGWIIEGEDAERLFRDYEAWCVNNGIVSEFVRFHPIVNNHRAAAAFYDVVPLGETVAMELSSPEVIWENINGKCRNMIRKAQKNGVTVYNGRYPEIYHTFQEIYNGTMDKDNATGYYYFGQAFYESLLYDLPQNAQVFYADYEGKTVAVSIMLAANGRMNYHLSGSIREYAHFAPTNLLLYEAALWGHANGCSTLHLGGGLGSGEDNLFKFKKSFFRGDRLCRFHIGKRIFDHARYEMLTDMRSPLPESRFFPQYRA